MSIRTPISLKFGMGDGGVRFDITLILYEFLHERTQKRNTLVCLPTINFFTTARVRDAHGRARIGHPRRPLGRRLRRTREGPLSKSHGGDRPTC